MSKKRLLVVTMAALFCLGAAGAARAHCVFNHTRTCVKVDFVSDHRGSYQQTVCEGRRCVSGKGGKITVTAKVLNGGAYSYSSCTVDVAARGWVSIKWDGPHPDCTTLNVSAIVEHEKHHKTITNKTTCKIHGVVRED